MRVSKPLPTPPPSDDEDEQQSVHFIAELDELKFEQLAPQKKEEKKERQKTYLTSEFESQEMKVFMEELMDAQDEDVWVDVMKKQDECKRLFRILFEKRNELEAAEGLTCDLNESERFVQETLELMEGYRETQNQLLLEYIGGVCGEAEKILALVEQKKPKRPNKPLPTVKAAAKPSRESALEMLQVWKAEQQKKKQTEMEEINRKKEKEEKRESALELLQEWTKERQRRPSDVGAREMLTDWKIQKRKSEVRRICEVNNYMIYLVCLPKTNIQL
jgi:hypothetical protein